MESPQTISQLTLIKTFSTSDKYLLHTQFNGKSYLYDITVDPDTSVHSFIQEALALINNEAAELEISTDRYVVELYAARKSGRKVSDLPSFQGQQKILKTGQKSQGRGICDQDEYYLDEIDPNRNETTINKKKGERRIKIEGMLLFFLMDSVSFLFLSFINNNIKIQKRYACWGLLLQQRKANKFQQQKNDMQKVRE